MTGMLMDEGSNSTITDKTILFASCIIFLFIANPFLGALYALYNLSKRQYTAISFAIAVCFAGLYGYTFLPYSNDDITRHYIIFSKLTSVTSISDLLLYETLSFKPDFLIDIFYYVIGRFSDNHQFVGMLGSSMYYGLLLGVCINWLNQSHADNYEKAFWTIILCMLALTPTNEFCGMRQGNANAMLLFFITWPKFYSFKNYIRILLVILPCLLHFSILPLSLLYLLASTINSKKQYA